MRRSLLVLGMLGLVSSARAQQAAATPQLDAIAGAAVRENRAVAIVAAVAKGNETLLLQAYGKAVVESDSSATTDTVFQLNSDTKQFTAAALLLLRDQGKLTLDDAITKWLPDFETHGHTVTLRHLLNRTSGIADIVEMPELRALRLMRNPAVTRDEVYKIINHYPFVFPTGTQEIYSNTNYWLLALIIEKAGGTTYADYVEKNIFAPLGMTRSMDCTKAEKVTRRASGYGMRSGRAILVPPIVYTGAQGTGAICSSAEDVITWLKALHGGKVLKPASYAEMIKPATLNDGTALRYSMGLQIAEDGNGRRFIGHGGGGFGYSSMTRWYPEGPLAVVVLTNSEPDEITAVTERLAAAALPAVRPAAPFTGDVSLLVGRYTGPGNGKEMVIEVTQTPQGIAFSFDGSPASLLPWVEDWTFRRGSALLILRRGTTGGSATELRFDTAGDYFILKRQ